MVLKPIYLDLSSSDDEEDDLSQDRSGTIGTTGLLYLRKVFDMDVEDDDVVIIDKPTNAGRVRRDKERLIRSAIDDDECCVLDTDPGAVEAAEIAPTYDSDELVVTGEKGAVACRDYPHARHSCIQFPFKTTPHASFCTQCFCYVCDSLAPCSLWGDGNNTNNHCHATEEPLWKTLRQFSKCGSIPAPATPTTVASSNLHTITSPTGVNRNAQATLSQSQTLITSPIRQSLVGNSPVSPRVSRQTQGNSTAVKKDPLVIKLKGKSRRRCSPPRHNLGVRTSSTQSRTHRPPPLSSFSGTRPLPSPRPRSPATSARIRDEIIPSMPPQPPQFTPYPDLSRAGTYAPVLSSSQSVPTHNYFPDRAGSVAPPPPPVAGMPPPLPPPPPVVQYSRPTLHPNVAYYTPIAPPLPNSPPPYIPPPPPPPIVNDYPPPGAYGHHLMRPPGADHSTAGYVPAVPHIPDSRYVSASAPLHQGQSSAVQLYADYSVQDYRSQVEPGGHYASSSYNFPSNGGSNTDILTGPSEGLASDATAQYDPFEACIGAVTSPDRNQQVMDVFNNMLEPLTPDDYLWDTFPY